MKVLQNQTTDYLSANFTESETAWLLASVYNYGDTARDGHFIYKYAGNDGTNTTDSPSVDYISQTPLWIQISPTNYYAMLDGRTNTQTVNADTIVITLASSNYDTFSLLGVEALSITISLYDNSTMAVVYTNVFDLSDTSEIIDFYTYCFNPFNLRPNIYDDKIPLYTDAVLTVIIDNTGSTAKCGRLVFGRSFYVGDTLYGSNLSQESYSRKETDIFGNETLVQLGSVKLDSYEVLIPSSKIPILRRKGAELDAVAILFIMDESSDSNMENLLNFGYWYDFNIILPNKVKSTISLTIKGIL